MCVWGPGYQFQSFRQLPIVTGYTRLLCKSEIKCNCWKLIVGSSINHLSCGWRPRKICIIKQLSFHNDHLKTSIQMDWFVAKLPTVVSTEKKTISHPGKMILNCKREGTKIVIYWYRFHWLIRLGYLSCEAQLAVPLNVYTYYNYYEVKIIFLIFI